MKWHSGLWVRLLNLSYKFSGYRIHLDAVGKCESIPSNKFQTSENIKITRCPCKDGVMNERVEGEKMNKIGVNLSRNVAGSFDGRGSKHH